MKTIPLHELDETMQSLIRKAASEPMVVVDQGVVIAEIRAPEASKVSRRFPPNHWDSIPVIRVNIDSTDIISEDRDR